MSSKNKQIVAKIDKQFTSEVGPVGETLIQDALQKARREKWMGHSGIRRYINFLAYNITQSTAKQRFLNDCGQILLDAQL